MATMRIAPQHDHGTTISPLELESRTMPTPSEARPVFDRGLDTSGGTGFVREAPRGRHPPVSRGPSAAHRTAGAPALTMRLNYRTASRRSIST
jgi:hypothetical protein